MRPAGPGCALTRSILLSYPSAREAGHRRRNLLSDLILAVPAAIVVGVVPGWFWCRLLLASSDLYERIAYSVALSITLVPAVLLLPTRLLGTGVSLLWAVGAPLIVFLMGLLAYLRFGAAKKGSEG